MGKGNRPNRCEALTISEEEKLWKSGQLGTDNPQQLLNTMWFIIQKQFVLRGCETAKQLLWGDIALNQDENANEYLEYTERATKTRSGADLSDVRPYNPKAWAVPNQPEVCPVRIYKEFRSRRPEDAMREDSLFYLQINHLRPPGEQDMVQKPDKVTQ